MTQTICSNLGLGGCFFLSIVRIAEIVTLKKIDVVESYKTMTNKTRNGQPYMKENCFVNWPHMIIQELAGGTWDVLGGQSVSYKVQANEFAIGRFDFKGQTHFVLLDSALRIVYDPLGSNSPVAKNGKLTALTIFRQLND
jgi:hypothetical protein